MRFQVPQFIEVEDKIFGPLTLKQFIYLAGGGGIVVVLWNVLPKFIAVIIALPVIGVSVALTFFKINNRPFIIMLESFFKYTVGQKLYIWKKEEREATPGERAKANPHVALPHLSNSKLKDLSWSLDVTKTSGIGEDNEKIVGEDLR